MNENSLLNKPIVLSSLLFLISILSAFIVMFINVSFYLKTIIISFIIALLLSIFQGKLKITLDKVKKIKIAAYYSAIYILLFIPISTFLSYIGLKHHIVAFITALMFTGIYLAFGISLYLGLLLGDKFKLDKI